MTYGPTERFINGYVRHYIVVKKMCSQYKNFISFVGLEMGPYCTDKENKYHLSVLFDALNEISENPAMSKECSDNPETIGDMKQIIISQIRYVNDFLDHPLEVDEFLRPYQQFEDPVVGSLTMQLADAVLHEDYTGPAGAKELKEKLDERMYDVSAPISEILDSEPVENKIVGI